jgi:membrane protein
LVLIVIGVAGLVFGSEAARQALLTQVQQLVGSEGAEMIGTMIASAQRPATGVIGTVSGVVMLLLGASGVFTELHDSLNKIWEVNNKPSQGFWSVIRERFVSFGMVLGIGFLLLVSLLLSAGLSAVGGLLQTLPVPAFVLQGANQLLSVLVVALLFAAIYRFLPSEQLPWNDLWVGSVGTAILFVIGKFAVGAYLGRASVGSAYGAAGSLVVLLVWIYYAAQLFFVGAEFTRAYARRHGSIHKREAVVPEAVVKEAANSKELTSIAVETSNPGMLPLETSPEASGTRSNATHRVAPSLTFQSTVVAVLIAVVGFSWWHLPARRRGRAPAA